MNSGTRIVLLAAAVVAAGIGGACGRDSGSRFVAAPRIAADLAAGSRVRGRITRRLQLLGPGGAVRAESTATESFDASVRDGMTGPSGPLVAVTSARVIRSAPLAFTDSAGHRHEIAFEGGGGDAPVRAVHATLDGRPFARVDFTWRRQGRGFLLAQRTTTFYAPDGRPAAREDQTAELQEVASVGVLDRSVAALSTVVRTVTLPTLLEAATVQGAGCMGITIEYAFASLGVAVAWAALLELWYLPAAWSAMGVAIGAWDKALGSLLDCMV